MRGSGVVLVLGGTGFIGSHVVDRLARDAMVRVFSSRPSRWTPPVFGVEYREGNFVTGDGLREALVGVETVVHCISTTFAKTSNARMAWDIQTNLLATVQALEWCVEASVSRVVYLSSGGTVYGPSASLPLQESSPTEPRTSYGAVKLAIEKYLAIFHHAHGLNSTVLRGSNAYGPRQNPQGQQGLINVALGQIAQGLPVDIYGDGLTVKDYVYVSDVAEACAKAVAAAGSGIGVFNIGSGRGVTVNEILAAVEGVTGRKIETRWQPSLGGDVGFVLDTSAAAHALNWAPEWSLGDGLRETWRWTQAYYRQ